MAALHEEGAGGVGTHALIRHATVVDAVLHQDRVFRARVRLTGTLTLHVLTSQDNGGRRRVHQFITDGAGVV